LPLNLFTSARAAASVSARPAGALLTCRAVPTAAAVADGDDDGRPNGDELA